MFKSSQLLIKFSINFALRFFENSQNGQTESSSTERRPQLPPHSAQKSTLSISICLWSMRTQFELYFCILSYCKHAAGISFCSVLPIYYQKTCKMVAPKLIHDVMYFSEFAQNLLFSVFHQYHKGYGSVGTPAFA